MSMAANAPVAVDARVLERSDTVLWTLAGTGIVLHNFASRRFLELDAVGYRAWGFLDGARSADEVVASVRADPGPPAPEAELRALIEVLVEHGFVHEVSADG